MTDQEKNNDGSENEASPVIIDGTEEQDVLEDKNVNENEDSAPLEGKDAEPEQDEIVEGKIYHLKKGDVITLPSNIEHGGYMTETGCRAIDIFIPPRKDLLAKLEEKKK